MAERASEREKPRESERENRERGVTWAVIEGSRARWWLGNVKKSRGVIKERERERERDNFSVNERGLIGPKERKPVL